MRVLGIDPGLTRCGWGVVDGRPGARPTAVGVGVIRTLPELDLELRLLELHTAVTALLREHRPDVVAVERVFTQNNKGTGHATAQAAGRRALTPGADLRAVDAAARDVIADAGHGENYVHGLGHGVGLEIHEAPGIGKLAAGTLPCGAAVTVEPGVYLPGWGGVRIEDTLVVTQGDQELLTTTDKTFTVI